MVLYVFLSFDLMFIYKLEYIIMYFKRELFTYLDFTIYSTIINFIFIPKYKDLEVLLAYVFYHFKKYVKKGE